MKYYTNEQGYITTWKHYANADFTKILKQDTVAKTGSRRQYALLFLKRNNEAIDRMDKIVASDPDNNVPYYD